MGKKNKLQKFEDLKIFKNVLEFPEDIKGNWNNKVFKNNNPIIEIAKSLKNGPVIKKKGKRQNKKTGK